MSTTNDELKAKLSRFNQSSPPKAWERVLIWALIVICVGGDLANRFDPAILSWLGL